VSSDASARTSASPPTADDYWTRRDALDATHADRLSRLAERCEQLDMKEQAQVTRGWMIHRDPARQYLFLPSESDEARPNDDAPRIVQQWYAKFIEHRRQHAAALFQLARSELDADQPARAYQLLHEVLAEDPEHADARRVLGYRMVEGRWRKPEAAIVAKRGLAAPPSLGFRPGQYWNIESEHFRVTTDHSEEAGRRLVERLEELYDLWRQVFFLYWSDAAALQRRFEGPVPASRSLKRHSVVLFRDRQEYVEQLKPAEPLIEVTVGYYREGQKTAYFYVAAEPQDKYYFHEVAHQLFSETGRLTPGAGTVANFWIIEGVAMYMESLQPAGRYWTVGGIDAERMQLARYRGLYEGFYVPLQQLVTLGRRTLQEREDLGRLYSQSAGLAAFLIDDGRGRYRRGLADYLKAVYQGRDNAETLAASVGVPLADLDSQYKAYLNVTDADLTCLKFLPSARSLLLGRTAVTDAGVKHLAGHTGLEWLELAYTKTSDAGVASLARATRLNRLNLEHTQVTDAALETIQAFRDLEILDLSGTRVTDAGLGRLSSLTKLKELWLGGAQITDAGLEHLQGLKRLETLDVQGTQVTVEGFQKLKKSLPALKVAAQE
jgi:hypothetical protein